MVSSGNRKTAYHHALFSYNQPVTQSVANVVIKTEKHFRIRIIKVGVNHFLLYYLHVLTIVPKSWTSLCELIHFISRLHLLHFTSSSTSFHDFIYFIELTHTAAVAEGDGCDSWRRRMRWLKESNALAEWDGCGGRRSRMRWQKESNPVAEGVESGARRRRMRWPKETNAVVGGDTFWKLITRDCGIILKLSVLLN